MVKEKEEARLETSRWTVCVVRRQWGRLWWMANQIDEAGSWQRYAWRKVYVQ